MNTTLEERRGAYAPNGYGAIANRLVEDRATDFFVYSQNFLPLAANATQTQTIPIEADSDFLAVGMTGEFRSTAAGQAILPNRAATVQLTDGASGRRAFDRAQDVNCVVGTAQLPAYWPIPKLFGSSGSIQITLADLSGADQNVRICLWGFKLFFVNMGRNG